MGTLTGSVKHRNINTNEAPAIAGHVKYTAADGGAGELVVNPPSYGPNGEIARRIGRPDASRAVGHANGSNPLAIIIPCHRAIGADGSMTGYRWGVEYKRRLLDHEFFSVIDACDARVGG